jgi:hypothetical protein
MYNLITVTNKNFKLYSHNSNCINHFLIPHNEKKHINREKKYKKQI